jgi:hypothetical protein
VSSDRISLFFQEGRDMAKGNNAQKKDVKKAKKPVAKPAAKKK